jgi:hypothetical protein
MGGTTSIKPCPNMVGDPDPTSQDDNYFRTEHPLGGRVFNRIKIDGIIDLGEANVPGDSMHFRALNAAQGLLAGA